MKTKLFIAVAVLATAIALGLQKANAQSWLLSGNTDAKNSSKLGTTQNFPLKFYTNNTEQMRIDQAGNVGIGVSSPSDKLHIGGSNPGILLGSSSIKQSGTNLIINAPLGSNPPPGNLILQTKLSGPLFAGKVGIGTTTPQEKLSISAGMNIDQDNTNNASLSPGLIFGNNSGEGIASKRTSGGNQYGLDFYTLYSPKMSITQGGNVGVGTTSPMQKFQVVGASILANNTTINPSTTANAVIAGAIKDSSGWAVTSGIGGKAGGKGQAWGIGAIGNNLYFGFSNGTSDNTMQTGIQITASRNVLLVPGSSGNVGIGATSPAYKLDVCGTIRAKELLVQTGWCDYVFNKDYKLLSLNEVENYINQNKHLPNVPSATEVEDKGVKVAQMDSILIKKVEELTLYIIDQNKQIQQLQQKVVQLEKNDTDKKN